MCHPIQGGALLGQRCVLALFWILGMRIVFFVFFLVWICKVLVWDCACRPGTKTMDISPLVKQAAGLSE